jgi:hypothetical protein
MKVTLAKIKREELRDSSLPKEFVRRAVQLFAFLFYEGANHRINSANGTV